MPVGLLPACDVGTRVLGLYHLSELAINVYRNPSAVFGPTRIENPPSKFRSGPALNGALDTFCMPKRWDDERRKHFTGLDIVEAVDRVSNDGDPSFCSNPHEIVGQVPCDDGPSYNPSVATKIDLRLTINALPGLVDPLGIEQNVDLQPLDPESGSAMCKCHDVSLPGDLQVLRQCLDPSLVFQYLTPGCVELP